MPVPLGCENLGFDVVGKGADLPCSSSANPGGRADVLFDLLCWQLVTALELLQRPLVQGIHGDSPPFQLVAQHGCQHSMRRTH